MPTVDVNFWAVLACTAASMAIGYVWYSMRVFGRVWMGLIGKTEEDLKKSAGPAMGLTVILSAAGAYVFAHIIQYAGADTINEGLMTGWWLWVGFPFTIIAVQNIFALRPFKLTLINSGYHLVQFLVYGVILTLWK